MVKALKAGAIRAHGLLRIALSRLDVLALFPVLILLAHELGGADVVLATGLILPALLALQSLSPVPLGQAGVAHDAGRDAAHLPGREALLASLERIARMPRQDTACILIEIDGWTEIVDRWGAETAQDIALRCAERLHGCLRDRDVLARMGDARFGVVLKPVPAARLGLRDAIVARLRTALSEAMAIDNTSVRITVSAGHVALRRDTIDPARATLAAAEAALSDAHRAGPNTVRAYAPGVIRARRARARLAEEVERALAASQIRPWFQPQVRARTGVITGFEALARWQHPTLGLLGPAEFLDAVEDAGQMDALGHKMLHDALAALRDWDGAGLNIPSVSVNFSAVELRNPSLAEHVRWELDRFETRPGRLVVEVLETIAAQSADDVVIAALAALKAQGIGLDLDDFGIGQASLATIRRFGVSRIKIDRSFITGLDCDPEQQAMVGAILAMARELGVETLAEGVETHEEQMMLEHMGCDHLQGFGIGRPMPAEEVIDWATVHNAGLTRAPGWLDRAPPHAETGARRMG